MSTPRDLFQSSLKPESTFRSVMRSDEMEKALVFALAQMAFTNPSADQLIGANAFIRILKNLGEPEQPPSKPMDKRLDHSVFPVVEHSLIPQHPDKKK